MYSMSSNGLSSEPAGIELEMVRTGSEWIGTDSEGPETRRYRVEDRLQGLERRLGRAERRARSVILLAILGIVAGSTLVAVRPAQTEGTGHTVKAPFRVVDEKGQLILEVKAHDYYFKGERREHQLVLSNPFGRDVVSLSTGPGPIPTGCVRVGTTGNSAMLSGGGKSSDVSVSGGPSGGHIVITSGDEGERLFLFTPKKGVATLAVDGVTRGSFDGVTQQGK
jgi:hypothetical protein